MNPRIYKFTSFAINPKTGERVRTTSRHRQEFYREAIANGFDKAHGGVRAYHAYLAKSKDFERLYAFLFIKDYGRAAVAFKQAMQEVHPDHGGDSEAARRIIAAWEEHKKSNGWSGPAPTVTNPYTHFFGANTSTGNALVTPLCLLRAGKRVKRGERYTATKNAPPTCPACLAALKASTFKRNADSQAWEDEYNARRQKEAEEATERCNHIDAKDDDCLICFPVEETTNV